MIENATDRAVLTYLVKRGGGVSPIDVAAHLSAPLPAVEASAKRLNWMWLIDYARDGALMANRRGFTEVRSWHGS